MLGLTGVGASDASVFKNKARFFHSEQKIYLALKAKMYHKIMLFP